MTEDEVQFYEFMRDHELLSHLEFGDPVEGQQWIGILTDEDESHTGYTDSLTEEGYAVIDPNWDEMYANYLSSIGHGNVEAIKAKVDAANTGKKLANFVTKYILTPLKEENIQSEKVYVVISNNFTKTWFDSIEEI
jgi:hypothetical protein